MLNTEIDLSLIDSFYYYIASNLFKFLNFQNFYSVLISIKFKTYCLWYKYFLCLAHQDLSLHYYWFMITFIFHLLTIIILFHSFMEVTLDQKILVEFLLYIIYNSWGFLALITFILSAWRPVYFIICVSFLKFRLHSLIFRPCSFPLPILKPLSFFSIFVMHNVYPTQLELFNSLQHFQIFPNFFSLIS